MEKIINNWPDTDIGKRANELLTLPIPWIYVGVCEFTSYDSMVKFLNYAERVKIVEIFQPYIDRFGFVHPKLEIMQGDVRFWSTYSDTFKGLTWQHGPEHLTKSESLYLLQTMQSHFDYIVLDMPLGFLEQDALDGNPHQTHLSDWYPEDLQAIGYEAEIYFNDWCFCVLAYWER